MCSTTTTTTPAATLTGIDAKRLVTRLGVDMDLGELLTGFVFSEDQTFVLEVDDRGELLLWFCVPSDERPEELNPVDPPVHLGAFDDRLREIVEEVLLEDLETTESDAGRSVGRRRGSWGLRGRKGTSKVRN